MRRDPLDGVTVSWPLAQTAGPLSLWEPIPMGVDELGRTVTMRLPERNVLLGGEPGAGKSAALSLILAAAAMDPSARLWLLDGKVVELAAWARCAELVAGWSMADAIGVLERLQGELEARYRVLLDRDARKITQGDGLPLHVVACDELALYLTHEDRKQRALRRAAAGPGRAGPGCGDHRRGRDAEARGRRGPEFVA